MENTIKRVRQVIRLSVILFLGVYGYLHRADLKNGSFGGKDTLKIAAIVVLLGVSAILVFWPDHRKEKGTLKKAPSLTSLLYMLACPFWGYLCAELVTTEPQEGAGLIDSIIGPSILTPKYFWLNILCITILTLFLIAITGSFKVGPMLGAMTITLFAIVNFYVYTFRGAAITACDFFSAGTAMDVAGRYKVELNYRVYLAICMCVFWWMVAYRIKRHIHTLPKHLVGYLGLFGVSMAAFLLCVNLFVTSNYLDDTGIHISYFNTMNKSYRNRGTAVIITRSIREAVPWPPEDYSAELAEEIAKPYVEQADGKAQGEGAGASEKTAVKVSKENPNIIIILDEAFDDMQRVGDFETSAGDYIPFIHTLEKDFPTGTTYVSGYGGRTSNTEFELLTGMSMAFLPQDSYPFQLYLNTEVPSLATILRQRGYVGIGAFHPHKAKNYRRNIVYPLLGFEGYYRENCPVKLKNIRGLASDASDFANIKKIYENAREESDAPFFFYTMTIQNHSDYTYEKFESTTHTVGLEKEYPTVDQYMSLCTISSEAFGDLVHYFEETGEPTIFMFMGDHQPRLPSKFYNEITEGRKYLNDYAKTYYKYNVQCYFWANFDLKEDAVDLTQTSMNYMALNMMKMIGAELTPFQEFLSDLQTKIPAINGYAYLGADGKTYQFTDKKSPYYEDLHNYLVLCYNDLLDSENRVEGFFD